MYISNKVVGLSLVALAVIAVDFLLSDLSMSKKESCVNVLPDVSSSAFVIPNLTPDTSSFSQRMNQASFGSMSNTKLEPQAKAQIEYCLAPEQNQVSWLDWVFSDSESATFHYLDLLELLTPQPNDDGSSTQRPSS